MKGLSPKSWIQIVENRFPKFQHPPRFPFPRIRIHQMAEIPNFKFSNTETTNCRKNGNIEFGIYFRKCQNRYWKFSLYPVKIIQGGEILKKNRIKSRQKRENWGKFTTKDKIIFCSLKTYQDFKNAGTGASETSLNKFQLHIFGIFEFLLFFFFFQTSFSWLKI